MPRSTFRRAGVAVGAVLAMLSLTDAAVNATAATTTSARASAAGLPYQDPSLPVSQRVADLLARMSLDEKIGQMTQVDRTALAAAPGDLATYRIGSVLSGGGSAPSTNNAASWADMYDGFQRTALGTPLGIPMIYGIDAVHGDNNVYGATIFPHDIGLGATRDPSLVQQVGRVTAEEVSGTGIDWDFAPCLCVARNDRWGRTYESFGETPDLPSQMTTEITGLQGETLGGAASVLATAKHYIGDGGTDGGVNEGNATLSEADLRAIHLPPFKAAVDRGVGAVMVSYSSWNGVKDHANQYLITSLLKGELGFSGFVVSDWAGVDKIDGRSGFTAAEVAGAVNAGIDMVMVPTDYKSFVADLKSDVSSGAVTTARIDDANRRILTKKFQLGLFEHPLTDRSYTSTVGSAAHRAVARQAVRESQVLLKNDGGVLPLAKSAKVFVAGKSADDIGNQSGGWTISWQGSSGAITPGTTILQGIRSAVNNTSQVTYSKTGDGINGSYSAAIAVVGETPYAEGSGDRTGSMGLDQADLSVLAKLKASGVPVVTVLVSGRPLDIAAQLPDWKALVAAWLPGTEGNGVSDVLFGDYAPTGKLPMSWMQSASQEPINYGDGKTPLFPYGYGLTYGDTTPPTSPPPTTPPPTTPPPTTPPPTGSGCTAQFAVTNSWSGGFQASVTVANPGTSALAGWRVAWSAPTATITSLWNGTLTQSGSAVTVANAPYNGAVSPGASISFGFTANGTPGSPLPTPVCTAG
ncbi:glycoside hydrolase family 3 C-terminal domain-containing protein [Streptomyces sp. NBC_00433]